MPIQHQLVDTDTLQALAQFYLGDNNRWYELVEFNKLDYPYVVESLQEKEDLIYANGYVTVERSNSVSAVTVKRGWTFKTSPNMLGLVKTFMVTEDTVVPAGQQVFTVHVRSLIPGQFGNIQAGVLDTPGNEFVENDLHINWCINEERFTGGQDINILATGEYIYIPAERNALPPEDVLKLVELIGGEDLALNEEGSLYSDGFGDLATVTGIENIKQAVQARLLTEKGDLPLHPWYGTRIPDLIGKSQKPYTAKLVELEVYEALSYEDRIQDVQVTQVRIEGTDVYVDVTFRPKQFNTEVYMTVTLNRVRNREGAY